MEISQYGEKKVKVQLEWTDQNETDWPKYDDVLTYVSNIFITYNNGAT